MWNYSRGQRVAVFRPLIGQYRPILSSDWLSLFGAEWGGVSGVFARVSAPPLRNIEHWTHIAVCELQTPNDRGIFAKICIESKSPSAAFIDCLKRNWFLDIFFQGIGRMRKWVTKNRLINLDLVVWCVLRCSQIFSNLDWLTLIPLWQRIFLFSLVHHTPDSSLIGAAVSRDDPWSAVMMTTIPAFKWAQYWVYSRLQRRLKWRFANLDLQNILKLDLAPPTFAGFKSFILRKQVFFFDTKKNFLKFNEILWAPQYMWGELIFQISAPWVIGNIPGGSETDFPKSPL